MIELFFVNKDLKMEAGNVAVLTGDIKHVQLIK